MPPVLVAPRLRPRTHVAFIAASGLAIGLVACSSRSAEPPAPAAVAAIALTTPPSSTSPSRTPFAVQPVVQLEDAQGNPVRRASVTVSAAISAGGGTLSGTATVPTNSAGQAAFTNLALAGSIGPRTLAFSTAGVPAVTVTVNLVAGAAATIHVHAGDGQTALVGTAVPVAPSVLIQDADGNPVAGTPVVFAVGTGGGAVTGATTSTDVNGIATVGSWTLGAAGTNTLTATSTGLSGSPVTFTATATSTPDAACQGLTPLSLGLGQVATSVSGSTVCIAGGTAHQEYLLVPFFGDSSNSASASISVTGSGLDALNATVPANRLPTSPPRLGAPQSRLGPIRLPNLAFEASLRRRERRELMPLLAATRAAVRARQQRPEGLSLTAIPGTVQVGSLVTLNANATQACSNPTYVTAKVMAVSQKAIIVADTSNPAGGFTTSQYQQIAATFDTLVYPLDTAAFGGPTDLDGNARVIIFYTRAVNALTPSGSSSYVGGFFFARDLYAPSSCAGSNYAEMFYMLAPDPTGVVNGNIFTTTQVAQTTIGTTAHEFQHLINASRRMYVNNAASPFEEVWLNEGLSHIAEELLFYRASGLAPRHNIGLSTLQQSQAVVDAFNNYENANFARYAAYLKQPSAFGPYVANDSLPTRGSIWSLLRYLADRHATTDGTVWYQLVNSSTTGLANLANVFGSGLFTQARDWSMSVATDDGSYAAGAAWQQPSWNFRSIYPALGQSTYPLVYQSLTSGATLSLTLTSSASAYVRFATPAGQTAAVQWANAPARMQFSVVRIQ